MLRLYKRACHPMRQPVRQPIHQLIQLHNQKLSNYVMPTINKKYHNTYDYKCNNLNDDKSEQQNLDDLLQNIYTEHDNSKTRWWSSSMIKPVTMRIAMKINLQFEQMIKNQEKMIKQNEDLHNQLQMILKDKK